MRLRGDQLEAHLRKRLAPVYVVSGDEPLLVGEAADAIRAAARREGYLSRELLEADGRFDWNLLARQADEMSLFAERKIVDLRLPGGKPGREGSTALVEWCQRLPQDTLLLLTLPKLDRAQMNSKWLKALDAAGVVLPLWPPDAARLPQWIEQRMRAAGLAPERGVAQMLAERTEGNLLAARQEIEKLLLLQGEGPVSLEQASRAISDSARFDVFALVDAALAGKAKRALRILAGLRGEGVALPVVLWALAREVRALAGLAAAVERGTPLARALADAGVWKNRQKLVSEGTKRMKPAQWQALLFQCEAADAMIKGAQPGDPWLQLEQILLAMAGAGEMERFWPLAAAGNL
ncbi:MAG TPA: DNA polymerase III subunit delta [Thiolapillus brandeum]|uniref:DNA polymerase III subunit delta n=1 Tax=Thiolapillus brandeum TaxID=1076588 RepID=A0A7C5MYZ7_9GAMM|nr:DNA polymerase III subunit delta [Thiolapillus brandeum]